MKLSQLLQKCNTLSDYTDTEISAVTDDSRRVTRGCLFVCIEGAQFDGHTAAADAVAAGAAAVAVQRDTGVENQVLVEDTRQAYSLICSAFFGNPADKLKIIGVTGTNGKTTTVFLLRDILESAGKIVGLIGTVKSSIAGKDFESNLTTPDPFELHGLFAKMVAADCEYCVMEVSSQALAQKRVAGISFEAAIFTNLSREHLDYHGDYESYKAAKRLLFEQTSFAVINLDDDVAEYMMSGIACPQVTFSVKTDASDYTAKNIRLKPSGAEYELVGKGVIGRVRLSVPGIFSVYNSMGAAVCAVELGIPFDCVLEAIAASPGVPGRLEVVPTDKDYTVIIDYAHTPDGLENILHALREITQGRLITVFGCGGDRDKTKRPLMGEIAERLSDIVVITSDNPRTEDPAEIIDDILRGLGKVGKNVVVEENRTLAIEKALGLAAKGDIVVLAGKGHETYQILKTGKIHYDEREVIARILAGMA
ncbi:MAG: UDP-N-acetylmuramoyl-L-alanyl-D-glutamate--2,6-diaminopimelate ligase [Clostridiales bacterium]|nr:UDP-N-acetylmuramoyl-L-alanyl-D-glutamate--2,6-diaminopimelate ligase [Clostridiales bacterium]